jgi:hypothetical protein
MAIASPSMPSNEAASPAPVAEPSRPTEPQHASAPFHEGFDTGEDDFDFHDTIPAPPWLDDIPDSLETPLVPAR